MKCNWCEKDLDKEEQEHPYKSKSDEIICDSCYDDEYRMICTLCQSMMDIPDTVKEGYFFMLTEDMYGRNVCGDELKKGIYQIIEFPFYADGITEGHFYSNSFKFIRNLTDEEIKNIEENDFKNCEVCDECAKKCKANILLIKGDA